MTVGCDLSPIIGESAAIREARRLIDAYAPSGLPMLLVGATGTGKELLARHIHRVSGRAGRWVAVNCAALPREIAESLLFGHRRGAFSGAIESRLGHFACAHRGSLLLDELLDLPPEVQPKLLRVLDSGEVLPLGEAEARHVDVRVIAAVQDDVWVRLESGTFRRDLFQRVAGIVIALPPLAERPEDIVPLARHFAAAQGQALEPGVEPILLGYGWPGNAREVRLAVERASGLAPNGRLSPAAVAQAIALGAPLAVAATRPSRGNGDGHAERRRRQLVQTLQTHHWDADRAATALGVHRATLFRHLKAVGLSLRALRKSQ